MGTDIAAAISKRASSPMVDGLGLLAPVYEYLLSFTFSELWVSKNAWHEPILSECGVRILACIRN